MAVAVGVDGLCHTRIRGRIVQQLAREPHDLVSGYFADVFAAASRTISSFSTPASFAVPAAMASGRSVSRRMTRTGLPSAGASSCNPPESVMTM